MRARAALSLAAVAACVLAVGFSAASFTATTQNPQAVSAIADWVAPTAEASTVAMSEGGFAGYVKAGATYYVYAKVTDSGNPPSGIASVKANVNSITSGQTAVPLVAGSYSVAGTAYNYRSAQLTAGSSVSGSKSYSLSLADFAGNPGSQSFSATVFKGSFEASHVETGNVSGGTAGKAEKGDTVSFEFNRPPDPSSIVSNWDGSGTKSVTVSIAENGSNDSLTVSGATLGSVALGGDFTEEKTTAVTFAGSTLSLEGSEVEIVLGAGSGGAQTNTGKTKLVWTPVTSIRDVVGDACSLATLTGSNQKQF
ncbi:MAG TPA: hypothetical protein VLK56_09780 [Solirubrobacterales bacterium]|nr:hypothetical protein [Solirubrobacterales bacterium]